MAGHKKVFVSFDWHHDKYYRFLLKAFHANDQFDFEFDDVSSDEINSESVGRVKAALAVRIRGAQVLMVIVGEHANDHHRDWMSIGYRNWINFEVATARDAGLPIVTVMLNPKNDLPEETRGARVYRAESFTDEAITGALRSAW